MASIEEQVKNCDSVICENIQHANGDRGLLAQNLLSQLRNLVEGLILWRTPRRQHRIQLQQALSGGPRC